MLNDKESHGLRDYKSIYFSPSRVYKNSCDTPGLSWKNGGLVQGLGLDLILLHIAPHSGTSSYTQHVPLMAEGGSSGELTMQTHLTPLFMTSLLTFLWP